MTYLLFGWVVFLSSRPESAQEECLRLFLHDYEMYAHRAHQRKGALRDHYYYHRMRAQNRSDPPGIDKLDGMVDDTSMS